MKNIDGLEPHIALGVYSDVVKSEIYESFTCLRDFEMNSTNLLFDSISVFKATQVIHLQPNTSVELMDYMTQVHSVLIDYEENCSLYYVADRWNPHVSLAKSSDFERTMITFEFLINRFEPIEATVVAIALIEIYYDNDGKCVGSETIDTIKLL